MDVEKGEKTVLLSSLLTLFGAIVKLIGGIITGTVVLIADAYHSFLDTLETFISFVGISLTKRKPTEKFPYGLLKMENLVTLFLGILILFGVYFLLTSGFEFEKIPRNAVPFAIFAFSLSVIIFLIQFYGAKKSGMESVMAVATESLFDILVDSLVFVIVYFNLFYLQFPFVIFLSVFMTILSLKFIYGSILSLLDVSPGREFFEEVRKRVSSIEGVKRIKDIKLRRAGPFILGEITVEVPSGIPTKRAHEIADKIEEGLKDIIYHVVVHIEPYEKFRRVAIPVKDGKISNVFASSEEFLVYDKEEKKIYKNPYLKKKVRRGAAVAKFLKDLGVDAVIVRNIGTVSFHSLRDLLIDVYLAEGDNPEEEYRKFLEGKLRRLERETRERI